VTIRLSTLLALDITVLVFRPTLRVTIRGLLFGLSGPTLFAMACAT
jgi:hypothetical protein